MGYCNILHSDGMRWIGLKRMPTSNCAYRSGQLRFGHSGKSWNSAWFEPEPTKDTYLFRVRAA